MELNESKFYLSYNKFVVGPPNSQYQLSISGFTGITDDPFTTYNINNMKFTTKDRDNDLWIKNCAVEYKSGNAGGWWYNQCSDILLNHKYSILLNNKWHSLPFIEMKIKPYKC